MTTKFSNGSFFFGLIIFFIKKGQFLQQKKLHIVTKRTDKTRNLTSPVTGREKLLLKIQSSNGNNPEKMSDVYFFDKKENLFNFF